MKLRGKVNKGKEYLKDIKIEDIEKLLKGEKSGKSREDLQAALLRKKGCTMKRIAEIQVRPENTIRDRLLRMENNGIDARYDIKSPGRPCKLDKEKLAELEAALEKKPTASGFERGTWTARVVAEHIRRKFRVEYTEVGVLALVHRLNFSVRLPRTISYKTPSDEERLQHRQVLSEAITEHVAKGHELLCMDSAGFVNNPTPKLGLYRKGGGGEDILETNSQRQSKHMTGVLGIHGIIYQYSDHVNSENTIAMLKKACNEFGKIVVITDNAGAHKSKKVQEYIKGTNGDVVVLYLLPYTPQENPIEIEWREIKRATGGRFFEGGHDEMFQAIDKMLKDGEVATVHLFKYMLEAIKQGQMLAAQ